MTVRAPLPRPEPARPAPPSGKGLRLLVADIGHVTGRVPTDPDAAERALSGALGPLAAGIAWVRHEFSPGGLSLVGVGPKIRVALHTWPEEGALTLDLYGDGADHLERLFERCRAALLPSA